MNLLILAITMLLVPASSLALPNMVRLGYGTCVSCHHSPQGGGLLNPYGRGIDEAQSLRAGEYEPDTTGFINTLSLGGRIDQDVRVVLSSQLSHTSSGPYTSVDRLRFSYRNTTTVTKNLQISAVVDGENNPVNRKSNAYDPSTKPGHIILKTALLRFRPKEGFEISGGRDALPTGLNIPDQTVFIKSRNRLGPYDTPAQAKAFFWGKRWQAASFAFAPGGHEPAGVREKGAGFLAEYDLLGNGRTIVGVSGMRGSDRLGARNVTGIYTRLGFGGWGVMAEHDLTDRELEKSDATVRFRQNASFVQVFDYPREWLAVSGIVEHLSVQQPYEERLWAYKGELSMRLSANWSVGVRSGVQRNTMSGTLTPVASVQLAAKPVR